MNVVGSYASKTMVKSDDVLSVDMVVVMPVSIFQEKDYLNYRYFYKRAYYLACIAAGLHDSTKNDLMLSFEYLNGNTLHPILVAKAFSGRTETCNNWRLLTCSRRQVKYRCKVSGPHYSCSPIIFLQ